MKKVFLFLLFAVLLNAQEVSKSIWEEAFTFLILKPIISFFIGILVGAYFKKFLKFCFDHHTFPPLSYSVL